MEKTAVNRIDLSKVKASIRRALPPGHPVRTIIENEPDVLEGPTAQSRFLALFDVVQAHRNPSQIATYVPSSEQSAVS